MKKDKKFFKISQGAKNVEKFFKFGKIKTMKTSILKIGLIIILTFLICQGAQAAYPVEIYFFYSQTCPVCHQAGMFLGDLVKKYPEMKVKNFEIFANPQTQQAYFAFGRIYNLDLSQTPIPVILIGEKSFTAYNQSITLEIEQTAVKCLSRGCLSPMEKLSLAEQKNTNFQIGKTITWSLIIVIALIIFFLLKKSKNVSS